MNTFLKTSLRKIALLSVYTFPLFSFAQIENPLGNGVDLQEVVLGLLEVVIDIGVIVVVFFIVFSGFNIVRSGRVKVSKKHALVHSYWWCYMDRSLVCIRGCSKHFE